MPIPNLSNSGVDPSELRGLEEDKDLTTLENIHALSDRYMEIDKELKTHDEYCKTLEDEQKKIEEEDLPRIMNTLAIENIGLKEGFKLKIEQKFQGTIVIKDPQMSARQLAWLEKNGGSDIIKTDIVLQFPRGRDAEVDILVDMLNKLGFVYKRKKSVHASTLASFMAEKAASAEIEPTTLDELKWRYFNKANIKKPGFKMRKRRKVAEASGEAEEEE